MGELGSAGRGLTLGDRPPGQRHVREERVERRALRAASLLPQVERLREAAHRPQRVVSAVVQLCNRGEIRAVRGVLPGRGEAGGVGGRRGVPWGARSHQ